MSMLLMLKEGRVLEIDSKTDVEPSFPSPIDDQLPASGGFAIAAFGISPYAEEIDRSA